MKLLTLVLTFALFVVSCSPGADEPAVADPDSTAPIDSEVFVVADEDAFRRILPADAEITQVATGFQFVEGPAWIDDPEGGYLVFSDIQAQEIRRWDPVNGVGTYRAPSGFANGNTLDLDGRLLTAQHDGRVTRTGPDQTIATVVDAYEGAALSSPNDVVVKSDGTIWFTDPSYGLNPGFGPGGREQETPGNFVYRYDEEAGELTGVVTDTDMPNGLCFSPDESILYVADSGEPRHIRAFAVNDDQTLSDGSVFAAIDPGAPDGIRCDELGNVWSSSGDGAQVFSPSGDLIVRILLPESAANLAFGGPDGHTVFFTARTSLYSVPALVGSGRP